MEKINNIEISNFKSIKHLKIDKFKKINVFVGQPNAGKSNILEAFGLFGLKNEYFNLTDFVRYKNFSDLFYEGDYSGKLASINCNNISLGFSYSNGLGFFKNEDKKNKNLFLNIDKKGIGFDKNQLYEKKKHPSFELTTKKYNFNKNNKNSNQSDSTSLNYPFGENLAQIIALNPILRNKINEFFKQNNLKLLIEKGTNELKIFKEYQDGTVFTLPYEMIADTLQRLIFYKAAIMSNKNTILLFEEPEAHCFEPYILEFTNDVKYDENDNQFFIVTHSDFIIKEFLRDDESKENTNIYLVNNVNGETQVKLLEKDKNEDVYEYGMNVFFNFESLWATN